MDEFHYWKIEFNVCICQIYFTMARGKLTPIFTPNILESMIECKLSQAYWMEYVNAYKTLKIYKK
jgi:hypothetical protein